MPQLPRAEDITRQAPTGTSRVTMRDTTSQYQALTSVGRALGGLANEVTDWQIAKAKAAFLTAKAKEDNAYDQDNDYGTMQDRYRGNMTNVMQQSAEMISDPRARNLFMTEVGVDIARGEQRISGIARNEERTQNLAFIEESLTGLQEVSMTGDPTTAMNTATELIGTAVARGDLAENDAGRLMRTWSTETLKTRIQAMEPERQLEELDKPWADKLPSGIRVQLRNEADKQMTEGRAMENVDSYFQQDLSYVDAREQIKQIEDPKLREVTERRFETEFVRQEKANNLAQEELFNQYGPQVRAGEMRVADIPMDVRNGMNTQVIDSLYRAEQNANTRSYSDRTVVDNLFQLYDDGLGDPAAVRKYFMENSDLLSDQDFEQWSAASAANPNFQELENKPLFTATQRVKSYITEMAGTDIDPERVDMLEARLQNRMGQYHSSYVQQNGRPPSPDEQDEFLRNQFFSMPTKESSWPLNESPADYMQWGVMTPEQRDVSLKYIERVNPKAYEQAVHLVTAGGQTPLNYDYLAQVLSRIDLEDL